MEETYLWPRNADDKAVAGGRSGQIFFRALGVRGLLVDQQKMPLEDSASSQTSAERLLSCSSAHGDLNRNVL
jgi:hypothetical protein